MDMNFNQVAPFIGAAIVIAALSIWLIMRRIQDLQTKLAVIKRIGDWTEKLSAACVIGLIMASVTAPQAMSQLSPWEKVFYTLVSLALILYSIYQTQEAVKIDNYLKRAISNTNGQTTSQTITRKSIKRPSLRLRSKSR